MRFSLRWLCGSVAAGSSDVTLSQRLLAISQKIRQVPQDQLTQDDVGGALWKEYSEVLGLAMGMRETDAALSVAHALLKRNCLPPATSPGLVHTEPKEGQDGTTDPALSNSTWSELFRAASFSDIESSLPLAYRDSFTSYPSAVGGPVDRDLLVMTGGMIPLTQRHRCADGSAFVELLQRWVQVYPSSTTAQHLLPDADALALLDNMQLCKETLSRESLQRLAPLILSLTQNTDVDAKLFYLLESLEPSSAAVSPSGRTLPSRGHGMRLRPVFAGLAISRAILQKGIQDFLDLERAYRTLNVIRKGYVSRCPWLSVLPEVERLCSTMDFAIQQNESDGNPMQLDGDTVALIRGAAVDARVRCLAMEMDNPFELGKAVDGLISQFGLERSFGMHHEIIQAFSLWIEQKHSSLMENSQGDEGQVDALHQQMEDALSAMIESLRAMVELRPRGDEMDAESKAVYQHSHALVLAALCASHDEKWLSEGYLIVVTHKYHQFSIDVDTIRPLVLALSRRGDCRVFNLVDLVTLYCGNKIDFITVEAMFRTCRVAGDYHRAKALYLLLKETVPGFLAKAPAGVISALRELRVIPPLPPNMFEVAAEDSSVPLV